MEESWKTPSWPPLFTFSGRENPLASIPFGSTRQSDSLSLSIRSHSPSPLSPTAPLRPSTAAIPALHPSTSTLARRLLPPLLSSEASESGPWSSAESTLFATSALLRAHPRAIPCGRSLVPSFPPPPSPPPPPLPPSTTTTTTTSPHVAAP